jgi:DNA-binding transcriptional LysR family regulator
MRFTLRQLAIFQAVAEHLSFTRAAEALHLSQPAVSMQVRQLEDNVDLPLFEQLGRKIYLTEAGRELYDSSRQITERLRDLEEVLNSFKGVTAGSLRVSVATTANEFSARLLAAFGRQFHDIAISLDVTNRASLLHQLDANECDLVIMGQPPDGLDVVAQPFLDNPLVMIAPPGHPLVAETGVSLARLESEPFVLREEGSGTRGAMKRFFDTQGVTLNRRMELGSNEAIKQVVSAGLGLAVVSAHTVVQELETGRLVILDVAGFPVRREWYLVHRKGKRLSPVAEAFCGFVLEHAQTFRADCPGADNDRG